jgi:hypothetical protein
MFKEKEKNWLQIKDMYNNFLQNLFKKLLLIILSGLNFVEENLFHISAFFVQQN